MWKLKSKLEIRVIAGLISISFAKQAFNEFEHYVIATAYFGSDKEAEYILFTALYGAIALYFLLVAIYQKMNLFSRKECVSNTFPKVQCFNCDGKQNLIVINGRETCIECKDLAIQLLKENVK